MDRTEYGSGKVKLPKPAYGVVKGAGKPEGFEPTEYKCKIVPAATTDFDSHKDVHLTATCQPSVLIGATFSQHPDRWTECLVTPAIKREILSTPGYPKPLNRPPGKRHHITQSPNGGLGVFATVDLKVGDLIFSERAIIISSPKIYQPPNLPAHFTTFQIHQAALCQKEKEIEIVFGRLHPEQREAYMALWNSHKEDGSGPLLGIFRTNAFHAGFYDDEQLPYAGVWNEASRFNHSCRPNTMRYFNKVTFGMEFRAVRSIKAGEELFTYYTDPVIHTSSRQEDLKPYGFQCGCESCRTPSDSDFVRMQLYRNTPMLVDYKRLVVFLMTPGLPESYVVDHSLQQLELIERTGLEGSEFYSSHLKFLVEAYCAVENLQKALIYLRKLEDFKRAESGGEEKSVKTLMQMVKEHPRWGWKTKIQGAMEVAGFYAHCSSVL